MIVMSVPELDVIFVKKKTDSRRRVIYMFQVFSKTPEV